MDSRGIFCPNLQCAARGRGDQGNIRVHSQRGRRYRCTVCGRTFTATTGTAAYRVHRPLALFVQVATLLAYGCPPAAIVAAFGLDERTVAAWQRRAGRHCERVHAALVLQPRDLGQVQADEIRVKRQGGIVWLALALAVPSRLWLGGVASAQRDGDLALALAALVRRAAARGALLWSVDGWRPYLRAITRTWRDPVPTGRRGRPRLVGWPGLAIGQVVKHHARRHLVGIDRRVARGTEDAVQALLARTQGGGVLNTAWIERLNATFRARLCALVRRGRALARQLPTLHQATYLTGTVYNFCTPHRTLTERAHTARTPAMVAAITDHRWTVEELLTYRVAPARWTPPKRRGRPSRQLQALIARWVT
jgi:transposase-like protein